jgi:type III pantothenate kinase
MNLIVDIGNTSIKTAVYNGQQLISLFREKGFSSHRLKKNLLTHHIDKAIISSVKEIPEQLLNQLSPDIPLIHILTYKSLLPFNIEYDTPQTLGADRIAAVAGAFNRFPFSEVLVIDAGTAITYDFLSGDIYKGGNISPGLMIRFRALNRYTGRLPLISPPYTYSFPGKNTIDAIAAGVITGLSYEINEYIRTFKKQHVECNIILSGGDSEFLLNKINYEVIYMPDIVTDGLNYILNYNAK